jgi:hypothetical protein
MRARILPLTVAGVLVLTTGVALAETNPADPEVVLSPVDDTTTTTVDEPETTTTTTETTVPAPPETTTTTTVVPDDPEPEAEDDATELEAPESRPQNHGFYVSQAAHDHSGSGNHGAAVSAVARTDVGKRHGGGEPPEE